MALQEELQAIFKECSADQEGRVKSSYLIDAIICRQSATGYKQKKHLRTELRDKLDPQDNDNSYTFEELNELFENWLCSASLNVTTGSTDMSSRESDDGYDDETSASKLTSSLRDKYECVVARYLEKESEVKRIRQELAYSQNALYTAEDIQQDLAARLKRADDRIKKLNILEDTVNHQQAEFDLLQQQNDILKETLRQKVVEVADVKRTSSMRIERLLSQSDKDCRRYTESTIEKMTLLKAVDDLTSENSQLKSELDELKESRRQEIEIQSESLFEEILAAGLPEEEFGCSSCHRRRIIEPSTNNMAIQTTSFRPEKKKIYTQCRFFTMSFLVIVGLFYLIIFAICQRGHCYLTLHHSSPPPI